MLIAHRFFTFSATFTGFPTPFDCLSITQMTRTCYFYPTRTISSQSFFLNNRSRSKLNSEHVLDRVLRRMMTHIFLFQKWSSINGFTNSSLNWCKKIRRWFVFFSSAYYYFHNKLDMLQVRQRPICWKTFQVTISVFVCDRYIGLPFDPLYQLQFYIYCST